MSTSELSITKRRLLGGIAIAAVGFALTACSDAEDKAASAEANPAVSNETTASTTSAEIPTADRDVDMEAALKPGSLKEMALGDPNAPVKVIEYMSMTCPHCAHFHENTFEAIKTKYVDTGKVYFVLREFPFPQDTASLAAFMLARCTTEDKFFPFVSMLLKQQRTWAAPGDGDGGSGKLIPALAAPVDYVDYLPTFGLRDHLRHSQSPVFHTSETTYARLAEAIGFAEIP